MSPGKRSERVQAAAAAHAQLGAQRARRGLRAGLRDRVLHLDAEALAARRRLQLHIPRPGRLRHGRGGRDGVDEDREGRGVVGGLPRVVGGQQQVVADGDARERVRAVGGAGRDAGVLHRAARPGRVAEHRAVGLAVVPRDPEPAVGPVGGGQHATRALVRARQVGDGRRGGAGPPRDDLVGGRAGRGVAVDDAAGRGTRERGAEAVVVRALAVGRLGGRCERQRRWPGRAARRRCPWRRSRSSTTRSRDARRRRARASADSRSSRRAGPGRPGRRRPARARRRRCRGRRRASRWSRSGTWARRRRTTAERPSWSRRRRAAPRFRRGCGAWSGGRSAGRRRRSSGCPRRRAAGRRRGAGRARGSDRSAPSPPPPSSSRRRSRPASPRS